MFLVREVFHCKPGKVRPMVDKFRRMSDIGQKMGMPPMRVLTDFAGAEYWTVVAEMEVEDLAAFEKMMSAAPENPDDMKQMEEIMTGYHDLVDHGRREIYRIEG